MCRFRDAQPHRRRKRVRRRCRVGEPARSPDPFSSPRARRFAAATVARPGLPARRFRRMGGAGLGEVAPDQSGILAGRFQLLPFGRAMDEASAHFCFRQRTIGRDIGSRGGVLTGDRRRLGSLCLRGRHAQQEPSRGRQHRSLPHESDLVLAMRRPARCLVSTARCNGHAAAAGVHMALATGGSSQGWVEA